MNLRKRNSSKKKFFAGILVALGVNQVSACSKTDERSTLDHRTSLDWSSDWIRLDYNDHFINLNQENASEARTWAKIQIDRDCHHSNHSDQTNVSPSTSDHGLLREITVRGSQLSITEQYAQLNQEQQQNTSILSQFQPDYSFFGKQNELIRILHRRIQYDSLASLYFYGTPPPPFNNHMHSPNSSGPQLEKKTACSTFKVVEKQEQKHASQCQENSSLSTFEEPLKIEPTVRGPALLQDKEQRQPGVTACLSEGSKVNAIDDSVNSKLIRLQSAIDLNLQNLSCSKIKVNRDCSILNDSDLMNASHTETDHCFLHGKNARDSKLSMVEQFASLRQEQEEKVSILLQVQENFSLLKTQNEQNTALLKERFHSDPNVYLNFYGIAQKFNIHLLTAHDCEHLQGLRMVHNASKMKKTEVGMNFSKLHDKSHASTFQEAFNIQLKIGGLLSGQEKEIPQSKVAAYESACLEGNRNADSPRSRLRKLTHDTAPGPPTGLTLISASISSLEFSWNTPSGSFSDYIQGYDVEWYRNNLQIWESIAWTVTRSYTASGLTPSTQYQFRVQAKRNNLWGPYSSILSPWTSSLTAPYPPTNLMRDDVNTNFTQIAFSWTLPTYNGGSPVTGYQIEWDNGTGVWSVHTAYQTNSSLTVTGLVAGTSYLFKVAAINSIGTSGFTSDFRITTAFVPDPPAALTIDSVLTYGNQIAFTWTAPVNDGGSPVTGYQIWWDQGTGIEVMKNTSYTLLSLTVTGLITGTTYNFRLQATNIVGNSAFTSVFPIIPRTVPDPPTALTKDETNSNLTQVALIWTAPVNNGGSVIIGYQILWDSGTGGAMQSYTGSYTGGTSLIAATGIIAGTLYKFNIASINIIGSSTFSLVEIVAGTPKQPNAPVTTYIPANNKIQVSWTAPTTVWSPITSYKIGIICKDLTVYQVTCAESATVILSTMTCSLDISVLQGTPILLLVTDMVVATIQTSNVFGDSSFSTHGGTAKIPCQVITRNTFVQSPISYKINTAPVAFGIPTYSLDPSCTLSTINYSLMCLNNSDSTKNFTPPAITSNGGSIQFTDNTAVGLYLCTVKASPSDAPSITNESFTFSLTAKCNQTITAPLPSTSPQTHVLGTVQNINFGLYTLLYSSCQQNIANSAITYQAKPLENGVVPPFVTNLGLNNFDIDTTSLIYGPGLHTLTITATVDPKDFVITSTNTSQTFTVAFNCSIVSMAPTTIQQDITHQLLSNPNVVTTIQLPSFTYLPSYCTATGTPNVVWSAVVLPSYATLTANQIVIDTNGATASNLGVFPIQLTASAQGNSFINVSSVSAYDIGIKIIYQSCIAATIQPQVFQDPIEFQLALTPASPSTILSFMMNVDSVGSHLSMPLICGVKTYSTGLSWISVLAPIDPLTQNFQLQITSNDLSLVGTKTVNIIVKFANASYPASLTQSLQVNLLHPCAMTVLKPPVIPLMTFTIGKAQTFAQFSQITDSVAILQNIPKFCGERKYELPDNLPFIKLVQPADPWTQNLQLQLYTSDEIQKGQHSINLQVTLVSYSSIKISVILQVQIKWNNKPYFQSPLDKTITIQMSTDSQPWFYDLPKIIDLDGDFVSLTVQLGSPAANFLKINGQASISCDDIKKNGSTNIKAQQYPITFILDDTKEQVKVQLTLLVFEPPILASFQTAEQTSQAASQQASSTNSKSAVSEQSSLANSTATSGTSSGQENTSTNNQLTVQSLDSLMDSFAQVKITESMSPDQKQQVLDQLAFDWKKAFAKRNAVKQQNKLDLKTVPVPPNPYIKEATNQGKIYIMFSSDVSIIPNLQLVNNATIYLDQINLYGELGKKINQRQLVKERVPVLQVKVIPGIESNSSDLEFIWNVTQQNPKTMDVQLYFYTPLKVSQNSVSIHFMTLTNCILGT